MRALIVVALCLPVAAQAACKGETFVSCPVGGGDVLEVCVAGDAFTYAFGPPAAPELQLSVPMAAGTVTPWSGVGRAIWSAVGFTNNGVTYEVWSSNDRLEEDPRTDAGVNVLQGGETLARITCQGGDIAFPFVLEDAMAANGFCWDRGGFVWRRGGCG